MRVVAAVVTLVAVGVAACGTAAEEPRPRLGINLAGPDDWNAEQPFADVFRLSRAWISQREGAGWGEGPPLDLDARGWPRRLEEGCHVDTPLCTLPPGNHYPSGVYSVAWSGRGTVGAWGAASVRESSPGRLLLDVDPTAGGFFVRISATDPADPVRDLRVIVPGGHSPPGGSPWRREFLDRWRGMACVRFMDLMKTNGSEVARFAERPRVDDATFTAKGVPVELLLDLAARLNADPWFCIPHAADDDFVRRFAEVVRDGLAPGARAWIEYSNEVWNPQFRQHHHAAAEGTRLGLADRPWEAAWRYTALRSSEIFAIFGEVFGGNDRLVRVLASQAANPHVAGEILGFRGAAAHADVLAIAPYVSLNVAPEGPLAAADVREWPVERVLDHLERVSLPESVGWVRENAAVARGHGLRLVAYEAGQHCVGVAGAENDDRLTALLVAANRHPRMERIYAAFLAAWEAEGGDLLCHFSSVGPFGKHGSWGLLEYADSTPDDAPKHRAVMAWARRLGQAVPRAPRRAAAGGIRRRRAWRDGPSSGGGRSRGAPRPARGFPPRRWGRRPGRADATSARGARAAPSRRSRCRCRASGR